MKTTLTKRGSVMTGVGALVLAVALIGMTAGQVQAVEVVKTGYLRVVSFTPLFVAIAKGFFKAEGIDTQLVRFASGSKMMAPLAANELDVAAGAPSAGLFNAIAQGQKFKIVADKGQVKAGGYSYSAIVVRSDLLDSGKVKSIKDLKGMKFASYGKGNIASYYLGRVLELNGLKFGDVEHIAMRPPNVVPFMKNKTIAASTGAEPWPTILESRGLARRLLTIDQVPGFEQLQIAAIIYGERFMKQRNNTAKGWMRAYVKGIRYYNARSLRDDEIVGILTKYIKTPAKIIKKAAEHPFYLDPNGKPHVESIVNFQKYLVKLGLVKNPVPIEDVVDLSYLPK